ncbi:MAG TPA: 23S rRNA methyltransferase, partial [Lactobacillus sp.]|nr:23S rRNA methyltransferase [Lactobacillus sp.]
YLSLISDTLVCDLKLFKQNGYETKAITPIDVAPQTLDMMCICRLDKEN